jgi:hypothetical protein
MGAQDNLEKVLRNLHVLLSKSEAYPKEPSKVIVDKQKMLDLLNELNECAYDIMDEYELTKQSRNKAEREFQKKGDQIIWDASRKAEDIYAASVMYTDEALTHLQEVIKEANASVEEIYHKMNEQLEEQEKVCRANQLELKSQLQNLLDTEKYLNIIEDRNKERERLKEKSNNKKPIEPSIYANRQTEIKINPEYFEKMGISMEENSTEEAQEGTIEKQIMDEIPDKEKMAEISLDLDADYFKWKEEQEVGKQEEPKEKSIKDKADRLQKVLKNLTSGKK